MSALRKQRDWTPAQRELQGQKLRERKIWLVSTGPKTDDGKKTSSQNALKHGRRSAPHRRMREVFRGLDSIRRLYISLNKSLNAKKSQEVTNELIDHMGRMNRKLIAEGEILLDIILEQGRECARRRKNIKNGGTNY